MTDSNGRPMSSASATASLRRSTASTVRPRHSASSPRDRDTSPKQNEPDAVMPIRPRKGLSSSNRAPARSVWSRAAVTSAWPWATVSQK